jgi:hypothetical protein
MNPNNLLKCTYAVCNFDEPMVSGMLPVNSFDDRSLQTQQITHINRAHGS